MKYFIKWTENPDPIKVGDFVFEKLTNGNVELFHIDNINEIDPKSQTKALPILFSDDKKIGPVINWCERGYYAKQQFLLSTLVRVKFDRNDFECLWQDESGELNPNYHYLNEKGRYRSQIKMVVLIKTHRNKNLDILLK